MNKKGLSMIITTLIIILLVLVAVGIIWVTIRNIMGLESHFKIYENKSGEFVKINYLKEAHGCTGECYDKENRECICLNDFYTKYYEEDISIEWLKKNCDGLQCTTGNTENCISYKCGKYIVEVNR